MQKALYDQIGKQYDTTRQADPEIVNRLYEILNLQKSQYCLDVGCGTGNYTIALAEKGINITGMDASEEMLDKARAKNSKLCWVQGDAKQMPFSDETFDGILCFLAIHHFNDIVLFFKEVRRLLKPNGKLLIFTNSPKQLKQLWLLEYFPKMIEKAADQLFTQEQIDEALRQEGFCSVIFEKYFVTENTKDAFLEVAKYHPELCLNANFRFNTSPFALAPDEVEIHLGLERLAQDLKEGGSGNIINGMNNSEGNFYYISAQ